MSNTLLMWLSIIASFGLKQPPREEQHAKVWSHTYPLKGHEAVSQHQSNNPDSLTRDDNTALMCGPEDRRTQSTVNKLLLTSCSVKCHQHKNLSIHNIQ